MHLEEIGIGVGAGAGVGAEAGLQNVRGDTVGVRDVGYHAINPNQR